MHADGHIIAPRRPRAGRFRRRASIVLTALILTPTAITAIAVGTSGPAVSAVDPAALGVASSSTVSVATVADGRHGHEAQGGRDRHGGGR